MVKKKVFKEISDAIPLSKDDGILGMMNKAIDESYEDAIAVRVISGVASGMTIGRMKNDGLIPIDCNPYIWSMRFPEFAKALSDAKKIGAEYLAEQTVDIGDGILASLNPTVAFKARQYLAGTRDKKYSSKGDDNIDMAVSDLTDEVLNKEMEALAEQIYKEKYRGT